MSDLFPAVGKRCRVFVMRGAAIFGFLRGLDGKAAYRLYGMPADTKCIGIQIPQDQPGSVAFLLESKEWEPLGSADDIIPEVQFEILTALLPNRLEKPESMLKPKFRALPPVGEPSRG